MTGVFDPVGAGPVHIFTVDLEDYFQVGAFERHLSRARWDAQPRRIVPAVDRLLEILSRHETKATFFCLGWIGDRYPQLIRRIAEQGHEIGSHGWWHQSVQESTPGGFRDDVRAAKDRLEMESGRRVLGFRAPNFSLVPGAEWVLDVLLDVGYVYDSSMLPIRRKASGYPGVAPEPHILRRPGGELLEVPPSTTRLFGRFPVVAGGNYFRQLPPAVTRAALEEAEADRRPGVFYIHPWEVDPDQPRLRVPLKTRIRHYRGLRNAPKRLESLLRRYRFTSVEERLLTGSAPFAPLAPEPSPGVRSFHHGRQSGRTDGKPDVGGARDRFVAS